MARGVRGIGGERGAHRLKGRRVFFFFSDTDAKTEERKKLMILEEEVLHTGARAQQRNKEESIRIRSRRHSQCCGEMTVEFPGFRRKETENKKRRVSFEGGRGRKKKNDRHSRFSPLLPLPRTIQQSPHLCLLPDLPVAGCRCAVECVDAHGLGLAVEELVHALLERAHAGNHDADEHKGERRFPGHFLVF